MGSRTFPDSPALPLDYQEVERLVLATLKAAIRDLSTTDVRGGEWLVFRPGKGDALWTRHRLSAPEYRSDAVWTQIGAVWKSNESDALMQYLWSRGAMVMTLSRDGDGLPTREAWERSVWGKIVHLSMEAVLLQAAAEDLVRDGSYTAWRADEHKLAAAASDVADNLSCGSRTVTACCPTIDFSLQPNDSFTIAPGVDLNPWTPYSRCLFLTQFHDEYLGDDMSTWISSSALTITTHVDGLKEENAIIAVSNAIDRAKWALMTAAGRPVAPLEGPVVARGINGWRCHTIRRGDSLGRTGGLPVVSVTRETAELASRLHDDLESARRPTPELDRAIWLFGRACNAPLSRDVLLDSAVGLETLLIPGPGEARYRFWLHGLAVIGGEPPEKLEDDLKTIYRLRSEAAHGAAGNLDAFCEIAPRARSLLGKAIAKVATLINSGELDIHATRGDVGKAVELFVKKSLLKSVHGSPLPPPT